MARMSDSPEVVGVVQPAAFEAVGPAAPTSFAELAAAVAPHRARLLEHEV